MNELYHYGVLGMKWGVRKDRQATYNKASKKLRKIDTKRTKKLRKAEKFKMKEDKFLGKSDLAFFRFRRNKFSRKAAKMRGKIYLSDAKAEKLRKKGMKWKSKMDKIIGDVDNASPEDIELGRKYAAMIMQEGQARVETSTPGSRVGRYRDRY